MNIIFSLSISINIILSSSIQRLQKLIEPLNTATKENISTNTNTKYNIHTNTNTNTNTNIDINWIWILKILESRPPSIRAFEAGPYISTRARTVGH